MVALDYNYSFVIYFRGKKCEKNANLFEIPPKQQAITTGCQSGTSTEYVQKSNFINVVNVETRLWEIFERIGTQSIHWNVEHRMKCEQFA